MMNLKNRNISVIGAVRSGVAAAKLIKKLEGIPFVSDMSDENELKEFIDHLRNENINFETGGHSEKVYDCEMMVVSPGVPADAPVLAKAREASIKLISEVELAYKYCRGNIIAITGTNGKTTTISLCGHVFNQCGYNTFVAGNIGLAFSEIALDIKERDFVALEVSSFQLDLIDQFKPKVAMILNITPDHLNRYDNKIDLYANAKQRIYKNQDSSDYLIINKDNGEVIEYLNEHKSNSFFFSLREETENGCFRMNDEIHFNNKGKEEFSCHVSDIKIKGEHNLANAMAVICAAKIFNLENSNIIKALQTFKGVVHRLEFVREINGIIFINDSKATNVNSVLYALKSFDEPIFLILGGQDKGNDYGEIKGLVLEGVKKIYAIGSSAEIIYNFFNSAITVEIKKSLEDVISTAVKEASEGDVVLLSPACASFDMFDNFEHRGRVFKEAVNNM
ncbi:MAG: UDP-N-acetylmuramoyl-L-alanine--D-glutamate ligase [Ignavibacteria bacterium]|nr:UDP-N-acetylmuramoyl-L-alanine--D-glutamate ligase [Ignavibacteria bacterium]